MAVPKDSSVLITGASRGIGRSIALECARLLPNPLILLARDGAGLAETAQLCYELSGKRPQTECCDLTKADEVEALVQSGRLNQCGALINNAGYFLPKPVDECTITDYVRQFEVNALSAIRLTQLMMQILEGSTEARIVFICSVTAQKGQARCGAYSVSKHALNGYIQSLREATLETSVGVTSVILGQTFSTSWDGLNVDPHRLADAADVGRVVASLCTLSSRTCVEEMVIRPQKGDL